jgi:hypothetical protein
MTSVTALLVIATAALTYRPEIAAAQEAAGAFQPGENPYGDSPIMDNSFLIEEAYNQENGVIQHISVYTRATDGGAWAYSFTEEWPVASQRHQLSLSLAALQIDGDDGAEYGVGDVALNYRYQLAAGSRLWFSPRLSLLVPSGDSSRGLGAGGWGLQANLPVSVRVARWLVSHTNAGYTAVRRAEDVTGASADTSALALGQGFVFLLGSRFNLMLEGVWSDYEVIAAEGAVEGRRSAFVSPGLRFAFDFPSGLQIVPGIAFPIGVGPSDGERSVLLYLSLEHPFAALGK